MLLDQAQVVAHVDLEGLDGSILGHSLMPRFSSSTSVSHNTQFATALFEVLQCLRRVQLLIVVDEARGFCHKRLNTRDVQTISIRIKIHKIFRFCLDVALALQHRDDAIKATFNIQTLQGCRPQTLESVDGRL